MLTLASRPAVAATDGAPVAATAVTFGRIAQAAVAGFVVTVTGAPATFDMRAAIEVSLDGGTNWFQIVRFKDITNAQLLQQYVRTNCQAAMSSHDVVASVLANAAAAAVMVEGPYAMDNIRAVTKLQTLTGGTAPTVTATVLFEGT